MTLLPVDPAAAAEVWDNALCAEVDPELFFADRSEPWKSQQAKRICALCDVRELCLATFGPLLSEGVVGGTSPRERRRLRKRSAA